MIVVPDDANLEKAAQELRMGGLIVMPTETVYGVAANAESDQAVAAIYAAKERPHFNPLIIHVADMAMARRYAAFSSLSETLAAAFWPGPLTLVLPRETSALAHLATAGLNSVAIRMPAHPVARQLLSRLDFGLAAPSANRSGHISPTRAEHAQTELVGKVGMILDGGPCAIGLESTVLDVTSDKVHLLRLGSVTAEMIEKRTRITVEHVSTTHDAPRSPGMLLKHYSPSKALRLDANGADNDEALLAFGPAPPLKRGALIYQLSESENLQEAAANLFAMLRAADASHARKIAVMPIPENGIGAAINDRLRRAAAQ